MSKFTFLRVIDEEGYPFIDYVSTESNDTIIVPDYEYYGLPQYEWRKLHHLTSWIEANKPNWQIIYKEIEYDKLMSL